MRIISGIYKGRRLHAGKDLSVRPTTDQVKEYIFNILSEYVSGKNIADVFCGSGSLGLESISRNCNHVIFVEKSRKSIDILKKNIAALNISQDKFTILQTEANKFFTGDHTLVDIYLLDPPFKMENLQKTIDFLTQSNSLLISNLIVVEHEIKQHLLTETDYYKIFKEKKFGRSLISFIQRK